MYLTGDGNRRMPPSATYLSAVPPIALQSVPPRRSSLKTVHRTVFFSLRPSRVRFPVLKEATDTNVSAASLEQATGIEPASSAWEAGVLPLNYACIKIYNKPISPKSQYGKSSPCKAEGAELFRKYLII